jgi:hypothetical protein
MRHVPAACVLALLLAGCAPRASAPGPLEPAAASDERAPDPPPLIEVVRVEVEGRPPGEFIRRAILRVTNVGRAPVYYSGDRADLPWVSLAFKDDPEPKPAYFYCGVARRTFDIKPGASVEFPIRQRERTANGRHAWDARPVRVGVGFTSSPRSTRPAYVWSDVIDFARAAEPEARRPAEGT